MRTLAELARMCGGRPVTCFFCHRPLITMEEWQKGVDGGVYAYSWEDTLHYPTHYEATCASCLSRILGAAQTIFTAGRVFYDKPDVG